MSLDQACFEEHVHAAAFIEGVERGWWGLEPHSGIAWPHALIWISAPPRGAAPLRYHLRFELGDYPIKGPTAVPWAPARNEKSLEQERPKGTGNLKIAFRIDWQDCLYVPWDRIARDNHGDWLEKYPELIWQQTHTIAHYLRLTRELLHSDEYEGN